MCFGSKSQPDSSAVGPRPAAVVAPAVKPATPQYAPPPGPPPSHGPHQPAAATMTTAPASGNEDYAPPPGPPPSHGPHRPTASTTAAPASAREEEYAPPPGPPPGAAAAATATTTAQPPPPSSSLPPAYSGPPQHDWQSVVPDTSLFPPPPDIFNHHDASPANNSSEAEMEAGEAWCAAHPLAAPLAQLDAAAAAALRGHNPRLMQPVHFRGAVRWLGPGRWEVRTAGRDCTDATLLAYPPLYCAAVAAKPTTVYYEVQIRPDSRAAEASVALGFAALPYPPFRLPGWHRGSLAVHGDDGHRYVNDLAGGYGFTGPFRRGERVGLGMTFAAPPAGPVTVFFTRDGALAGSWDLHEEADSADVGGVQGLEGWHDISAAIGTFDLVSIEVLFEPSLWMYKEIKL